MSDTISGRGSPARKFYPTILATISRDHLLFCKTSEQLDKLANHIGVRKLSDFLDTTVDLQFNMSEDAHLRSL
ncbi:MAG: hypothetical protein IPH37_19270 [Burkholderiales bacterium]|nr:hypothetical protein [Burkholderiales bacterium]